MFRKSKPYSSFPSHLTLADRRAIFWCVFKGCAAALALALAVLLAGLALQNRRQAAQADALLHALSARLAAAAGESYAPDGMPPLFLFDPATELLYPLEDGQAGVVGPYSLEITGDETRYTLSLVRTG